VRVGCRAILILLVLLAYLCSCVRVCVRLCRGPRWSSRQPVPVVTTGTAQIDLSSARTKTGRTETGQESHVNRKNSGCHIRGLSSYWMGVECTMHGLIARLWQKAKKTVSTAVASSDKVGDESIGVYSCVRTYIRSLGPEGSCAPHVASTGDGESAADKQHGCTVVITPYSHVFQYTVSQWLLTAV
jgi:hypothetical protein